MASLIQKTIRIAGFTLIELLMSILVVAVLSTVAISQFIDFGSDAKVAVTKERLNSLKTSIVGDARFVASGQYSNAGYESHCQAPPTSLSDLVTMPVAGPCNVVYDPFLKKGWRGPYVSSTESHWNKDAWGTALEYFVVGPPVRTIRSCGPNLTCGDTDDVSLTF